MPNKKQPHHSTSLHLGATVVGRERKNEEDIRRERKTRREEERNMNNIYIYVNRERENGRERDRKYIDTHM